MNEHAIRQVDFHGMRLSAHVGDSPSQTYVAVPPICRHLGLNVAAQCLRIQAHAVLAERSTKFRVPSRRGAQETLCIRLDALNLWLAMIQPNSRRDPEMAALLIAYQRECCDVLYQHFFGAVPLPKEVIERHDLSEIKTEMRGLRLVVDNTQNDVKTVKDEVKTVKGQVQAQGWQLADVRGALDEVRATCEQNGLDIGEQTTRLKRVEATGDEVVTAIRAVRKHPRRSERRSEDTGRKFADALRKGKQQHLDFGEPA